MMLMTAGASSIKGGVDCELSELKANEDTSASAPVDDDDDIICLDCDEAPSLPPPKPDASQSNSRISRLLIQVIRLHLSERCCSPGCAAVLNEAQKLGKKIKDMEALAIRLRNTCTAQQQEIVKLSEEAAQNKKRLSAMEGVMKRQSAVIRDLEAQLNASMTQLARPSQPGLPNLHLHKPMSNSPLIMRSMNAIRAEQTPTMQRRVHSDANLSNLSGNSQATPKAGRFYVDQSHKTSKAKQTSSPVSATQLPTPVPTKTLNVCNPRNGRIQLDVPFIATKLLIEFTHPIGTPILDYPVECHHCKIAGPIKLTLEIKTEPLNFLLTKKVQGVVKYTAFNGCRPKNVKMFCYLESAIKVRRWISSLVHTFAETDKIKFDIVLAKEQQIACFDRIVMFAVASTGTDKFVTNRVIFNIGQQAELTNERPANPQPKVARVVSQPAMEPMETSPSPSSPAKKAQIQNTTISPAVRNLSSGSLDDSNFEVYRPF